MVGGIHGDEPEGREGGPAGAARAPVWFDPPVGPGKESEAEAGERTAPEPVDAQKRERRLRAATVIVAVLAIALFTASAGYKIGTSGGEDLDAARAAGTEVGETAAAKGKETDEGYDAGFKYGRKIGFAGSYATGYRQAFEDLFEAAGLPSPGGTAPDAPAP